jgi:hypothetical protein
MFLQMFQKHVSNVLFVFFCMLQLLYLYVSKTNWVFAHGMCMRSDWWHGPTVGALASKPDAGVFARSLSRYRPPD